MVEFALLAATNSDFNLLCARWQMGFTLGSHIILATFGIGMPVLLLAAEWRYLATSDAVWKQLAHRWSKVFAVLFAVGAVSGTVLSFELGLLWPEFMARYGAVIGFPFAMEGFAFFLEAIFVGIYLYGWNRLSPWAHWWSGVPIAISGALSGWFVVTVNAWMNTPAGVVWSGARPAEIDPLAALLNPGTGPQTTHMLLAAYMTTGFLVASFYAWRQLRLGPSAYNTRAMMLGMLLGVALTPLQALVGDWAARVVADVQPVKLAAMEGQFRTEAHAPLRIGGIPDEAEHTTRGAIEIPGMLSWLAYRDTNAVVRGLDDFPPRDIPPAAIVHVAFQVMVGAGTLLILLSIYTLFALVRDRALPEWRGYLIVVTLAGPLSLAALEAGWVVTEVGRQPWVVQGIARTADMVTPAPYVGWLLLATIGIYLVLAIGTIAVLRLLGKIPMESGDGT